MFFNSPSSRRFFWAACFGHDSLHCEWSPGQGTGGLVILGMSSGEAGGLRTNDTTGKGVRKLTSRAEFTTTLFAGSTMWAQLLTRGLGTQAHLEPIAGEGQMKDVQAGDVKGSVRMMGCWCLARRGPAWWG